ncbi:uncharacterized protein I303_104531 [Kwoniella dejecticola CBS 10117]|uniref:Cupin type-1 domain-containing protein n=1 Tax=Kwoniella dejecticola CBS 10117 TaxID=1296121 RepID=A0A1A6A515_9TREE|nr:uncharacterized protein I303_04492 [Kwoniella dejecticola CBS 10117]OBR85160.1 hypothetical protein I303_04492 [Kwoniella dejecticola CBS 10117]
MTTPHPNPEFKIETYHIAPTDLIPNSGWPLIVYRQFYPFDELKISTKFYDLLLSNDWHPKWIYQYGETQRSHYHPTAHEVMAVLSGSARIRFGAADLSQDPLQSLEDPKYFEKGGITLDAQKGDVFLLPAGLAHKTHYARPSAPFLLLTPEGRATMEVNSEYREKLREVEERGIEGFAMMGGYPKGYQPGYFAVGGEGALEYSRVWSIPPSKLDPLLGDSEMGTKGLWKGQGGYPKTSIEKETTPKEKPDWVVPFPEKGSWRADLRNIDQLEEKLAT